jgi:hypothetical protein
MKANFLSRKTHRWIALLLGIQAMFWMVSGAYMATIDIDFIHGDPLVRNINEPLPKDLSDLYPISAVLDRYPQSKTVNIVSRFGSPHYVVQTGTEEILLDARSGELQSPIQHEQALQIGDHYYAGKGNVQSATLLADEDQRPTELQTRPLPLWQITFDDSIDTTFYVSPSSGELISRRHSFWRLYDFLWMFHIMDYENRTDFNNNLLRVAALIGLGMSLSGVWLLFYSFTRRKEKKEAGTTSDVGNEKGYDLVPKIS